MNNPGSSKTLVKPSRRDFLRMMGASTALFAAGGLAACGGGDSGSGGREGPFTFTAWSLNEEASEPVIRNIIDDYSQQNDVQIQTEAYPYDEYLNQMLLEARGQNITGAAQLDIAWVSTLAALGGLRDLGALTEGAGYTDAALESGQFEGTQYGLPWTTGSTGLIGNAELLERAGVSEMPQTIEEFEETLEALRDEGVTPYAAMTDPEQLRDIIFWMWTYGSDILNGDEVTLGDEGSVRAVEWYKSLLDRDLIAPNVGRFDARSLFSQGNVGFYDDAIVAKGILTSQSPDPEFDQKIVPVPRPVEGSGESQALLWGHLVVVFEGDGADSAADFARRITSDRDTVVQYFEELALPPTTEEALEAGAVQEDEYINTWTQEITETARPSPFWRYPEYSRMESILGEQVQAALGGNTSAQEAMDRAREEIQSLID